MEELRNLFLLLLVCVFLQTTTKAKGKPCPPCGNAPVPFPFSTDKECGDPSYKIRCSANQSTLFFDTLNNSYAITSISPSSQRFVISPSFLGNNSCISFDLSSKGIQLNPSLPFSLTANNTVMLFNCTSGVLQSPLNCSSDSLCHLFRHNSCRSLPFCCTLQAGNAANTHSIELISAEFCSAYRSYVNLEPHQPRNTWRSRAGLELQWALPREPLCNTQAECENGTHTSCMVDPDSVGGSVNRCFCASRTVWNPISGMCEQKQMNRDSSRGSDYGHLFAGLSAAILLSLIRFLLYRRQHLHLVKERLAKEREKILNLNNTSGRSTKNFTSREIKHATKNFSRENLLGAGGYGEVYKGVLQDGTLIAVKCAKIGNTKSIDQILNEVRILSQVNHRSLVHLLGCCVELSSPNCCVDRPLMVYEFVSNGTLADHLYGFRSALSWHHRLSIAHQTAEGLAYLHFSAMPPIYHRDVKSTNILLDEKFNAKVSDFGLSRLAISDLSHISTCAQGTLGYLDPEYYRNFQLTDKSDVYSFGVVLLELLTSQKAIDFSRPSDDVNLVVYIQRLVMEERLMEAVDPTIKKDATQVELDTMKALGFLAMGCLEEKRQNRPSMKEVEEEIELIMTFLENAVNQNP